MVSQVWSCIWFRFQQGETFANLTLSRNISCSVLRLLLFVLSSKISWESRVTTLIFPGLLTLFRLFLAVLGRGISSVSVLFISLTSFFTTLISDMKYMRWLSIFRYWTYIFSSYTFCSLALLQVSLLTKFLFHWSSYTFFSTLCFVIH